MAEALQVEFFKLAKGNTVGQVLERLPMSFEDEAEFSEWASVALPNRRGDNRIWEWPDAVRATSLDGAEIYRWTLWDQMEAGKPVANASRA